MSSVSPAATSAGPQPPDHVGRFRISRLLGTGSMGAVYLAEDPVIHRKVAIKTLNLSLPAQDAVLFEDSFLNEARAAGRLNHPHIVTVYDAGRIDGVSYIAMEYLKGQELKDLIGRGEKFSIKQAVEVFVRVADALQYAHEHGIVHRDVKPANIFMIGKTNPKVLDFGIAQAVTTFSGSFVGGQYAQNIVGTPNYMSPELIQGKALDGRSDVFSLGVVMYEVLTHRVPFKGTSFEELTRNIVSAHPTPPHDLDPGIPIEIARIVAKALAKNPDERYQTARDLGNDLRKWMASQRVKQIMSASVRNDGDPPVDPAPRRVLGVPAMLALAAVVGGAVTAGVWFTVDQQGPAAVVVEAAPPAAPATGIPAPSAVSASTVPAATAAAAATTPPSATGAPVEPATSSAMPSPRVEAPARPRPAREPRKIAKTVEAAPVAPPATGTLALAVSPWGEVYVNGAARGLAPPLSALSLPTGKHTIEIRNGDAAPYATTVEIKADETTRVRHKF